MEYMTISQASEQWGISNRRIQILCKQGRIEGAERFSRVWAIPKDVPKPEDARIKSGNYLDWRKKIGTNKESIDTEGEII